jgi:hypothetical protein
MPMFVDPGIPEPRQRVSFVVRPIAVPDLP